MNKNVKIGICLLLLVCGLIFMGAINKREGLESRSNSDENRPKCIKPSSLDGNCGPVRKNKKGLSYKACPGHCEDPTDCYDDDCEKYGLIIKESKNGSYRVQSGPIDMSEIDTVSKSNISNWPVVKNGGGGNPYPRGHAHNNDKYRKKGHEKDHHDNYHNHFHKNSHHDNYHTDDEDDECY